MRVRFVARLVRRELRRLGAGFPLVLGSIAVGVAALVSVRSFAADVRGALAEHGRELLGADLALRSRHPFPDSIVAVLDSAGEGGVRIARVTDFASMGYALRTDGARLVRVRAIEQEYPFYGTPETEPVGAWDRVHRAPLALVDPPLLAQLDVAVGDTLALGEGRFVIAGTVTRGPDVAGPAASLAPGVVIGSQFLAGTGLLTFGSLGVDEAYLAFASPEDIQPFLDRYTELFRRERVSWQTATGLERELLEALGGASRFLSLVGLIALGFSAVGVMSAVRLFALRKVAATAILRCLGATRAEVLAAYVGLAATVALAGAVLGAVLGVVIQLVTPSLVEAFLPTAVSPELHWGPIAAGIGVGVWVAILAALPPLLGVRRVSPLRALRQDVEPAAAQRARRDPWRIIALGLLIASFLLAAALELESGTRALVFAGGFVVAALVLYGVAAALIRLARWASSRAGGLVWRHGLANLHRPGSQTLAVTLALGFGAALVTVTHLIAGSLLGELSVDASEGRPNLVLFDIQRDQVADVAALVPAPEGELPDRIPIVPARFHAVKGELVADLLGDSTRRVNRWALRRQYRLTYRDSLGPGESVVTGQSWRGPASPEALLEASLDRDIAEAIEVELGDSITLDVQGVRIGIVITSLREVRFTRLEPNFFLIVQSGGLEDAPGMFVIVTRLADPAERGRLLRAVAEGFPNVVGVDLTVFQRSLDELIGQVAGGVRFLSLVCIGTGVLVLLGAIAASRLQRISEGALLRTLGATSRQVRSIMLAEYAALGLTGTLVGASMGAVAAWALCRFFLQVPFTSPLLPVGVGSLAAGGLTALLGWLGSRGLFARPPLVVLRAE